MSFQSSSEEDDDDLLGDNETLERRQFEAMPPLAPYEPSSDTELDPADSSQENEARITDRLHKESMAFVDIVTNKSDLADRSVELIGYDKRLKKGMKAMKKSMLEEVMAELKKLNESSAIPRRANRSTQRK